ncbi:MAG: MBG domain-containing protein [Clostridia bacterium]|nr:MBG domain-containing protein [Clostridia bacterium]
MTKLKKILTVFVAAFAVVLCAAAFAACGGNSSTGGNGGGNETPTEKQFTGITFNDKTCTYDGTQKSVLIDGTLPQGTSVEYENNTATNAGTYNATATLKGEGYKTATLTAVLKINKAQFGEIAFDGANVVYDGKAHSLFVDNALLPAGTSVSYENNGKTEKGEYEVVATLTNPNYVTKKLTAKLKIYSLADVAKNLVNAVLNRPEPWSFLPEAFKPETMAYNSMPVGREQMSGFVNVSTFGKRLIGKQMNVVYDVLDKVESALGGANAVFTAGDAIATVYQNFIDKNPDNYDVFTGSVTIGGVQFKLKIESANGIARIMAGNGTVSVELANKTVNGVSTDEGRIQITDGVALKYEATPTTLKLAVKYTLDGKGMLQQIDFARNGSAVAGHLYEYIGTDSTGLKTSAVIAANSSVTCIVSNKRETDDLQTQAYEEVYNSKTGEMIGGEVAEKVDVKGIKVDFDTLWLNLYDLGSNLISVRVEKDQNTMNADTIYINGNSKAIKTKLVGGLSMKAASRRFDIEMKDVWYIVAENDGGKITYKKQKTAIPMLCVQREQLATLSQDFNEKNNVALTVTTNIDAVMNNFELLKETFTELKDLVSYDTIVAYIGTKNSFFN